jgi:thioredoxin reductase (NADPH)
MLEQTPDCLIIGGGPAGLTAAIYLARFHLRVIIVDRGGGRAQSIPMTHNHAGYPGGVVGADLVANMQAQARNFGAEIRQGSVTALRKDNAGFAAMIDGEEQRARTVLLATGVTNNRPTLMPQPLHDEAVARNLVRYCPICDGYEVTDADVGVIGSGERGTHEALFLRSFTRHVTLIAPEARHDLTDAGRAALDDAGIALVEGPIMHYAIEGARIVATTATGVLAFAALYPALGSKIHYELAHAVGAQSTDTGITVDTHQRTTVAGLYAAGDVVLGLDQISHAMGEAAVASTTIRNDLNAASPLRG